MMNKIVLYIRLKLVYISMNGEFKARFCFGKVQTMDWTTGLTYFLVFTRFWLVELS